MNNKTSTLAAGLGHRLGSEGALCLRVYVPHRPDMPEYKQLQVMRLLKPGDIADIVDDCGNHWRKIFVIFAKIASAMDDRGLDWKRYMHEHLLQKSGLEQLLFASPEQVLELDNKRVVHLISGKACAECLGLLQQCEPIGEGFYRNREGNVFITPYFDYRQLSNAKIDDLLRCLKAYSKEL